MIWTAMLVACLVSAPTDCRSHTILVTAGANPVSAYVEAQARAAEWVAERGLVMKSLRVVAGRES